MEALTQPSTQLQWDERRSGTAFSSPEYDDVICILHPSSASAIKIAKTVWTNTPENILQYQAPGLTAEGNNEADDLEMEELGQGDSLQEFKEPENLDIALRTSANVKNVNLGFVFGREPSKTDILCRTYTEGDARISGMHFRIFVTKHGILMLQDMSTNGTYVDEHFLQKNDGQPQQQLQRMLSHGSMIEVVAGGNKQTSKLEKARFIVKLPQRRDDTRYRANLEEYLLRREQARADHTTETPTLAPGSVGGGTTDMMTAGTARFSWGMGWDGNGKYNPIGELGKGAFATVFKVATADQGEIYAAKRIDKAAFMKKNVNSSILDQKFWNELNIMKKVDHPHIVAFHNFHLTSRHLFIIMEFVPAGDMSPYIQEDNWISQPILQSVTKQLLHALNYIHYNGIVHRDIKPENILVCSNDPFVVKLSDFGLSKMIDEEDKAALVTFCGTLLYCAPEVYPDFEQMKFGGPRLRRYYSTPKPYSSAVDIWSLGVVLWYFVAHKPPYKGSAAEQGHQMLYSILHDFLDYKALTPEKLSPDGHLFITNTLNVVAHNRPSAKELLGYDWVRDVPDVVAVPDLDQTESLADIRLETVQEGNDEDGWGDEESNAFEGFDESDSFARAAEGLLPDAVPEVPGLIRDSTSIEDRAQTERQESLENNSPVLGEVTSSKLEDTGDDSQQELDQDDTGSDTLVRPLPLEEPPANFSVVYSQIDQHGQGAVHIGDNLFNASSTPSEISIASEPSVLEGWSQAHVISSDPAAPNQAAPWVGMPGHSGPARLFGEIMEVASEGANTDAALAEESGVFGATQPPMIHQEALHRSRSQGSMSSTSLSGTEQKMDHLNVQSTTRVGTLGIRPKPRSYSSHTGKRHRLAEVTNADEVGESSSEGEPAAKKSMTLANRSPSHNNLTLAPENDYSHSISQDLNSLRIQSTQLGVLTPLPGSFNQDRLILNKRMTMWGRAPDSTHVYHDNTDVRVPKQGIDIYFWSSEIGSIPAKDVDLRELDGVYAVIMTRSRNGIKINNVRLSKSPDEGPFKLGKLFTGDIIEVFDDGESFLKYRCDFNLGESAKERAPGEKFVVEVNPGLYAAAVARRIQLTSAAQVNA